MKKSNVKSLCVAMAAAMTVGSMTPAFSADAASKAKFDKTYKKVRQDIGTYNYNITGLKKNYKVKWTIEDGNKNVITDGVSLDNQGKKVTSTGTSLSNKLTIEDISSLDAGLKAKTKYYVVARVYVKNTKTKKYEFSYKLKDRIYFFADAEDVTLSVKENTISNDTIETKVGTMLDFDSAQKPKNATTTVYYSAKNASGQAIELKKGVTGTALTYAGSGKITFNEAGEFEITVETKRSKTSKVTATKTVKVIVKEDKTEEPTPEVTEGAKQTGVQTITLTTKENVNAASAASIISVKKGSSTVNLDSTNPFIVNGNTVYIKTASRMTAGDYTVTVNGKNYTFKAEDERVDKIEILNDKLVVKKAGNDNKYYSGTVGYHVLNQFAEDMTRRAQVTANSNSFGINSSTGTVTYTQSSEIRIGDKIALTLINTTTGKSDSKILTVSAEANVAEIEVADIQGNKTYVYNKDKKALTEDTDLTSDKFYILFTAKDQYENVLNPSDKNGRDTVSKGILFSIPGLTNLGIKSETNKDSNTEVTQMEVNGKNYFAVQLTKKDPDKSLTAGTDNTLMICKGSGKNVTTPITVNAGSKVATITVSAPDVVIAGQPATFEFTALDANGNDVSNKLAGYYTNVNKSIYTGAQDTKKTGDGKNNAMTTIPDNFVFEKNYDTNKVELKYYSDNSDTDRPQYVTFVTATNQVVSVQFTVKAQSKPTTITKIAADKLTTVNIKGQKLEIKQENITIEDQYGKVMPQDEIKKENNTKNYRYKIDIPETNVFDIVTEASMNLKEGGGDKVFTATVKPSNDEKDPNPGEVKMSITLQKNNSGKWEDISGSEYSFTIKTVDYKKDFKSYSVDDIGKLFDKDRYSSSSKVSTSNEKILKRELGVYGVMSDGTKVRLPGELYNAQNSLTTYENNGNGFIKVSSKPNYADKNDDYKTSISIVIGHSGETITKELVISKAAPTVNKLEARDGSITKWKVDNIDKVKGDTVNSNDLTEAILERFKAFIQYNSDDNVAVASGQAYVIDKEGLKIPKEASITISDKSDNCTFTIIGNGTTNLKITGSLVQGNEFTVTVKAGSATAKSKFVVQRNVTVKDDGTTSDTKIDSTEKLNNAIKNAKDGETVTLEASTKDEKVIITESNPKVDLVVEAPVTYDNSGEFKSVTINNQADKTWIERKGNKITLATGGTIRFDKNALKGKNELKIAQTSKNHASVVIEKETEDAIGEVKNFIVNIVNALKPVTVKVPSTLVIEEKAEVEENITLEEEAKGSTVEVKAPAKVEVKAPETTVTLETAAAVTVTGSATNTIIDIKNVNAASNSSITVVTGSNTDIKVTDKDATDDEIKNALDNKITIKDEDGNVVTGGTIEVKNPNGGTVDVEVKPDEPQNPAPELKQVTVESIEYKGTTITSGSEVITATYNAMVKDYANVKNFTIKLNDTTATVTAISFSAIGKDNKVTATVDLKDAENEKATLEFTVDDGNGGSDSDTEVTITSITAGGISINTTKDTILTRGAFDKVTGNDIKVKLSNGEMLDSSNTNSGITVERNTTNATSAVIKINNNEITGTKTFTVKLFEVTGVKITSGQSFVIATKSAIENEPVILTASALGVSAASITAINNASVSAIGTTETVGTITVTSAGGIFTATIEDKDNNNISEVIKFKFQDK